MPEKQREPKVVPPTDPRVKGRDTCRVPAAPAQPVPPHCPSCGYTEEDAQINGDHRLCNNAGNAPWEITPIITPIHAPLAAPSPVLTPASNAITKCAETSKCVHGVRLKEHCAECPQSPPLLETPVLTQPSAEPNELESLLNVIRAWMKTESGPVRMKFSHPNLHVSVTIMGYKKLILERKFAEVKNV